MRTELSDVQRECVDAIRVSAQVLLGVISDVLDISRLEAGKADLEAIPFDLAETMEAAVCVLKPRAREKGLELTCTIAPDVPRHVIGDPARLRQVLLNLLGNAVKFTESGGVDVMLDAERPDGPVRIVVADTGMGMTEETRTRLFQKFTQADSSISRRFGGSGLGLAISRELVTLMGGQIAVDSTPGQGSRFTVTLPLPPSPCTTPRPANGDATNDRPAGNAMRLLVVDDNAINRRLVTVLLENAGHRVDVASDGWEAIKAAARIRYDAILMDMRMPAMNGVQATRRIRALPSPYSDVPVIALTADALSDAAQRYRAAGLDAYLSKPLSPSALFSTLQRLARDGRPPSVASVKPVADPAASDRLREAARAD